MKKRVWIFFYVTVNLQRYISELSGSFRAFRRWGRSTFHWIVPACYRARFSLIAHGFGNKPMRALSEMCHHSKRDERGTVGKENPGNCSERPVIGGKKQRNSFFDCHWLNKAFRILLANRNWSFWTRFMMQTDIAVLNFVSRPSFFNYRLIFLLKLHAIHGVSVNSALMNCSFLRKCSQFFLKREDFW